MMSQESQPSLSISARDMGRNGAVPKRLAQYGRQENRAFGAGAFISVFYHPPARNTLIFLGLAAATIRRKNLPDRFAPGREFT
jgi:hypothetical protein